MDVERFEGNLRQISQGHRQLPRLRVGRDRSDELRVDPETIRDEEEAVLVVGLRFAEVDRSDGDVVERISDGDAAWLSN